MPAHDDLLPMMLTVEEAFAVMSAFVWDFAQRAGDDLLTLIGDTEIMTDGRSTDPAAWDDWLACVQRVRMAEELRPGS